MCYLFKMNNFILPLPPIGTNNAYHSGKGHWYKDSKVKEWEEECLWKLKKKVKLTDKEFITVNIGFYFGDHRRRDIDSLIKFTLDLGTKAGFYKDDSLITDLIVSKRIDSKKPRLEICVY